MSRLDLDHLADRLATEHLLAMVHKQAITEETQRFIEWAMLKRDKVSPDQVWRFLERQDVPLKEVKPTRRGEPLAKGESVRVDIRKVPGHLQDVLEPWNDQIATVIEVDGDDVVLEFPPRKDIVRVDGGIVGPGVGLYRHTPAEAALEEGRRPAREFEVIYVADKNAPPPSEDQIKKVQDYIERGYAKGEKRQRVYYTGLILGMFPTQGKTGPQIFKIFAQQRDHFPRALNPYKGEIYYIGVRGRRPGSWKREYEDLVAQIAGEEE